MDKIQCFFVFLGLFSPTLQAPSAPLIETVYEWKELRFAYENEAMRNAAIQSGDLIPNVSVPMDVGVHYTPAGVRTVFVTIPRYYKGTPASLGTVSTKRYQGELEIIPYPSWSWHRSPRECRRDRIVSAHRIKIDPCGNMWVVDDGKIADKQICSPQLLSFNLRTNQINHRYEIPKSLYESTSLLTSVVVDVRDPATCKDTFVYIADTRGFSIIVHDVKNNQAWKAIDKSMYPNPDYGTITVAGESVDIMDGIVGMDISPFNPDKPQNDRLLYYQPLASIKESRVLTSYLRNQSLFANNPSPSPKLFHMHTYASVRSSQSDAMAIDVYGVAHFGLLSSTSLNCWDTNSDYGGDNIHLVYNNSETMQFPTGIKAISRGEDTPDELWVLTNRYQKVLAGTMNPSETNFRISMGIIEAIIYHSNCQQFPY